MYAHLTMAGLNVKNMISGCCGLSSDIYPCFYEIHRAQTTNLNAFRKIYVSPMSQSNQNPQWPPHKINMGQLCSMDDLLPLRFIIIMNANGQKSEIGQATTSVDDLK